MKRITNIIRPGFTTKLERRVSLKLDLKMGAGQQLSALDDNPGVQTDVDRPLVADSGDTDARAQEDVADTADAALLVIVTDPEGYLRQAVRLNATVMDAKPPQQIEEVAPRGTRRPIS